MMLTAPVQNRSTALAIAGTACAIYDSALVPANERIDRFFDHVERNLARFEFGFCDAAPFSGRVETPGFGPIRINRGDCTAGRWSRTEASLSDHIDHFNLYMAMLIDRRFDALRVSEIAYECGFNDLSYFNRAFRSQYGETPDSARTGTVVQETIQ